MSADSRSEAQFMASQLRLIAEGGAWYGDSVFEILEDVTAVQASARAIPKGHTMWEIVLHLTGWAKIDKQRLLGEVAKEPPEGDFPKPGTSEAEWQQSIQNLRSAILELADTAAKLSEQDMQITLARGGTNSYRENLHGALQHIVYHAGQLGVLRRQH